MAHGKLFSSPQFFVSAAFPLQIPRCETKESETTMLSCTQFREAPALLNDLLEDSERIYHRHCAIIQRVFHEQWLDLLGEEVGKEQIEDLDGNPAQIEARVRVHLLGHRLALWQKKQELILEQQDLRAARERALHAYIEALVDGIEMSAVA